MFKSKILGLVAALSLALPAVASPTLITNGGFENGLTGWTCIGADMCGTTAGAFVHSGNAAAWGFDNNGFSTLSQTIATNAGSIYDFSFWSATNNMAAGNVIRYQIDNGSIFTVGKTFSPSLTSTSFTATGASSTIKLMFETDPGTGTIGFDDVSVTDSGRGAVPEPTSIALIGAALLGMGAVSRKRKQQ